jgi:hypothetical protein
VAAAQEAGSHRTDRRISADHGTMRPSHHPWRMGRTIFIF